MKYEEEAKKIRNGGIGLIPTDTIYGVIGSALYPDVVERIYKLKGRSYEKPFIVLISLIEHLHLFDITLGDAERELIEESWPGQVSIIFPSAGDKYEYIHRGTNGIAFRLPKSLDLTDFIDVTGPLVAPSANPQGEIPATKVSEAMKYFGDRLDFYIDGGIISGRASKLIRLTDGKVEILR